MEVAENLYRVIELHWEANLPDGQGVFRCGMTTGR
jgi:hypothetical protein